MKNLHLLFLSFVFIALSCKTTPQETQDVSKEAVETVSINIKIEGMTCTGCEQTIQNAIESLEGIASVKASHTDSNAIVEVEPTKLDTTLIRTSIENSGYKVLSVSSSY